MGGAVRMNSAVAMMRLIQLGAQRVGLCRCQRRRKLVVGEQQARMTGPQVRPRVIERVWRRRLTRKR